MKLIPMTDFVLDQYQNNYHANTPVRILNYANFLKQPLKLGMFIPCVNEDPFYYSRHGIKKNFQQAKDRVLFEPLEDPLTIEYIKYRIKQNKTLEWLANFTTVTLNKSAIKQLGL